MDGSLACTIRTLFERRASKRVGNVNIMQRDGSHFTRKGGMAGMHGRSSGRGGVWEQSGHGEWGHAVDHECRISVGPQSSLPPKDSRSGWSAKHQAPSTKHQAAGWGRRGRSVTVHTTRPDLGWSLALNTFSRHPQNKFETEHNSGAPTLLVL